MITALTRGVSPRLAECQLTFLRRESIDYPKACEQHKRYNQVLRDIGLNVVSLPPETGFPDAVFVEDTAVIIDEVAVICTPAHQSRRDEIRGLTGVLSQYRPLRYLNAEATLEGGDVIFDDSVCFVGNSTRTNRQGIEQFEEILGPFGYQVIPVSVTGCLHLSTGASYLGRNTMLVNSQWVDTAAFRDHEIIEVPRSEPWAANVLVFDHKVIMPDGYPKTRALLEKKGFEPLTTDISEFIKAEAGVTCMSLIFEADPKKAGPRKDCERLESAAF